MPECRKKSFLSFILSLSGDVAQALRKYHNDMVEQSKHDLTLDAVRGLAAQTVVIGHTSSAVFLPSKMNELLGWSSYSAVLVFFILSGYVIVGSLIREVKSTGDIDCRDFAIRRFARIMPPFLFTIVFVFWFFFINGI